MREIYDEATLQSICEDLPQCKIAKVSRNSHVAATAEADKLLPHLRCLLFQLDNSRG